MFLSAERGDPDNEQPLPDAADLRPLPEPRTVDRRIAMDSDSEEIKRCLTEQGYAVSRSLVPEDVRDTLSRALASLNRGPVGSREFPPHHSAVTTLLNGRGLKSIVRAVLGVEAKPVRVLSFDKTPRRNWAVAWHQDRTIAVAERWDEAPVSGWTLKAGVPHCEAPVALLEQMLTVRWHLDACGAEQGGLRVLPGSHRHGRLCQAAVRDLCNRTMPLDLDLPAGAVLLMRPLLVHGSRRSASVGRRRVLHIEMAARDPPAPLRWAWD